VPDRPTRIILSAAFLGAAIDLGAMLAAATAVLPLGRAARPRASRGAVPRAARGRPVLLVARTHAPAAVRVETKGGFTGIWVREGGSFGQWCEAVFQVPAEAVRGPEPQLRLSPEDRPHAAYGVFHYWAYQG